MKLKNFLSEFRFIFNKKNNKPWTNFLNYLKYHLTKKKKFFISHFGGRIILSDRASFPSFRDVFRKDDYRIQIKGKDLIIIDAGANIGCGSIYFLMNHDVKKIYAYEPLPQALKFLELNTRLNNLGNKIQIQPFGLLDKNKNLKFDYNGMNSHISEKGRQKLKLKSFDQEYRKILKKEGKIDFVKMDIEGAESEIINNSKIFPQIKHLIIEIHGSIQEKDKMIGLLKGMFKTFKRIEKDLFEFKN